MRIDEDWRNTDDIIEEVEQTLEDMPF